MGRVEGSGSGLGAGVGPGLGLGVGVGSGRGVAVVEGRVRVRGRGQGGREVRRWGGCGVGERGGVWREICGRRNRAYFSAFPCVNGAYVEGRIIRPHKTSKNKETSAA